MTEKQENKPAQRTRKVERSKRLIGLDEFFFSCPLRREHKAALRMRLGNHQARSQEEWNKIVDEFLKDIK